MSAGNSAMLQERYGRAPRRLSRRGWIWLGSALIVLSIIALAWFSASQPTASVQAKTTTSAIDDHGNATVRFTLNVAPGTTTRCAVDARGEGQSQVGWKYVDVPAADAQSRTIEVTVKTVQPAMAGSVDSCWIV